MAWFLRIATLVTPSIARSQCGWTGPPPLTLSLGSTFSRCTDQAFKNISTTAGHDHILGPGGTPLGGTTLPQLSCSGSATVATFPTFTMPVTLSIMELPLTKPV